MKKLLSIILALTLLCSAMLAFTSCGDDDTDGNQLLVKTIDVKLTDENYAFVCDKENTALVESFNAFDSVMLSGSGLRTVELCGEYLVQNVVYKAALARARNTRYACEHADGEAYVDIFKIILRRTVNSQCCGGATSFLRHGNLLFTAQILSRNGAIA